MAKQNQTEETKTGGEEIVEKPKPSKNQSQEEIKLTGKDFCDSKAGLQYKNRIIFFLDKKYPNQVKTVSEWETILTKDELI